MAEELKVLARAGDAFTAGSAELPLLRGSAIAADEDDSVDGVHRLIATASESMTLEKGEAARILFGNGERRWERNLTERRHVAATTLGISTAKLRRKSADGNSPYDALALELALSIVGRSASALEDATPAASSRTARHVGARLMLSGAATAVVGLGIWVLWPGSTTQSAESTDSEMTTSATLIESSPNPASESSSPTTTEAMTDLVVLRPVPCPHAVGVPDLPEAGTDARGEEFVALYEEHGGESALGCAMEPVNQRGGLYWQELRLHMKSRGGLLGLPDGSAMYLNAGQWRSYIRIGGGDGARSVGIGGVPTGEVNETADGWTLVLDGTVELISEGIDGSYYWVPPVVLAAWNAQGRSSGIHGSPAGSPHFTSTGLRQDFANGYFMLGTDGLLNWTAIGDAISELPPPEALRGRIISAPDGTSWLVDDQLRRWWIVDVEHWYCAGADKNVVDVEVSGAAIRSLEYGGLLDCPASLSGANAKGGTTSRKVYCQAVVQEGASETTTENGHACTDGTNLLPIDIDKICVWQFGDTAFGVLSPSDLSSWRCETA